MQIAPIKALTLKNMRDKITIWNIADIHYGSALCDEELLDRVIKAVAEDKTAYWVGCGDYIEAISHRDEKRFDPRTLAKWLKTEELGTVVTVQQDKLIKKLKPISRKCLGIGIGNHEETARKYHGLAVGGVIAHAMHAPYLDYYGIIPLILDLKRATGTYAVNIVVDHGHGASATAGGRANVLQRAIARHHNAHIIFMGHLHHAQYLPADSIGLNATRTGTQMFRTHALMSGAFYRAYSKDIPSYAEKKGYAPSVLGPLAVELTIERDQRDGEDRKWVGIRMIEPRY